MLKKLRRKMILINVLTVGVVLLAVFAALCLSSAQNARRDLEAGLHMALRTGGQWETPPVIGRGWPGEEKAGPLTASVVVSLDEQGNILSITENNAALSQTILDTAVKEAAQRSKDSGMLHEWGLFFQREKSPEGQVRIAFGDSRVITNVLLRNAAICAGLYALCLGALLLISIGLSEIAVRPVQQAWEQQKQFVADASHELKTPLTVILANNNILLSHPEETICSKRQWLESTGEEANRMKKLIDEMLLLAKSEAERPALMAETVDLSELLEAQSLYFESVAYEKKVQIQNRVQTGISIQGDRELLNQLIQILLDNAVKYAAENTEVTVTLKNGSGGPTLEVNNRGETVSAQALPHLFDRFYRTEQTRNQGGYGLGLAIAKNVAILHQASISASSTEQEGTTFRVQFSKSM